MISSDGETKSTQTDSAGNYIFTGLNKGEYTVRPVNFMPYIFPESQIIGLEKSNAIVNFTGVLTTEIIKDDTLSDLLTRNNVGLEDWLADLTGKWNTLSLSNGEFNPGNDFVTNTSTNTTSSVNQTNICGDGVIQSPEICDDGINNGKQNYCSTDCLYRGESRFVTPSSESEQENSSSNGSASSNGKTASNNIFA